MSRIISDEAFIKVLSVLRKNDEVQAYEGLLQAKQAKEPMPPKTETEKQK